MRKNFWKVAGSVLAMLLLIVVACTKEPDPVYPSGGGGSGGGGGNSSGSAPSTPTGVSATVSGSQIRVSWNSVSNATSYKVYWSENGSSYNTTIGTTSNTYIYDNVPYENNYYKVKAINSYGESAMSSSAYCHYSTGGGGGGGTSISAPTGLSAEASGSRVYVTWNSVSNASSYRVYRSSSSSGSYSMLESTSSTYYYDASPNTDNYYKVTAVNSNGEESEKSLSAYCYYSGGGGGSAPSAPTGVSAEVSGSKIRVSWNSVSNADEYYVYWSSTGSGYEKIGTTYNTYYNDNNPSSDNYYKIKAKNSNGTSSYSSYAYCHYSNGGGGGGGTVYSPCPVHYTSHTATSYQITLRWTNPTSTGCGTPTKAYLRVKNPDSNNYANLETLSGSASTVSFSYGMWANSEGYVYCGIITENSAGTSGGSPLVYNWKTNTWYGGNGLELTEDMKMEEIRITDNYR